MTNKLLDGITVALHEVFGDDYHYYVENVQQKIKLPCFTVDVVNPSVRAFQVNKYQYRRIVPCVIHCFTNDEQRVKHSLYDTGEKVIEALEYIVIEDKILRAYDINFQIVEDDVLQIFLTYSFYTTTIGEETYMEDLEKMNVNSKS